MEFSLNDAAAYMKERATEVLQPAKDNSYVCPICESGSGSKGTGITSKDGQHFKCWAGGCFNNASILDILAIKDGINHKDSKSYPEVVKNAARYFGITIAEQRKENPSPIGKKQPAKEPPKKNDAAAKIAEKWKTWSNKEAREKAGAYLETRGISKELAFRQDLFIGYDNAFYFAADKSRHPAIVFCTTTTTAEARCTDGGKLYQSIGRKNLFNFSALGGNAPVFVCEGAMDALSIIDVGGIAVGLSSVSDKNLFIEKLKRFKNDGKEIPPILLVLDADDAGRAATADILESMKKDFPYVAAADFSQSVLNGAHDANDAIQKDRAAFKAAIEQALADAAEMKSIKELEEAAEEEAKKEEYLHQAAAYAIENIRADIAESKPFSPTGFGILDGILDGGLYPGLYFIGAISSLGKTTFTLQLADQVAAQGQDVLFFSLEMSRAELIGKSVSRLTYLDSMEQTQTKELAQTLRGIATGSRYKYYTDRQRATIDNAFAEYGATIGQHMFIFESVGKFRAGVAWEKGKMVLPAGNDDETIVKAVYNHIKTTGRRPLVIIDYIQILAPYDLHATDKQNTDKAVLELKRLSRAADIPIIGISSFNRDNYNEPVSMAAFKESGAIEYSSDVLIGLQYPYMEYEPGEGDAGRKSRIRASRAADIRRSRAGEPLDINLKILKNRNGAKDAINFVYHPWFNCYREKLGMPPINFEDLGEEIKQDDSLFSE